MDPVVASLLSEAISRGPEASRGALLSLMFLIERSGSGIPLPDGFLGPAAEGGRIGREEWPLVLEVLQSILTKRPELGPEVVACIGPFRSEDELLFLADLLVRQDSGSRLTHELVASLVRWLPIDESGLAELDLRTKLTAAGLLQSLGTLELAVSSPATLKLIRELVFKAGGGRG